MTPWEAVARFGSAQLSVWSFGGALYQYESLSSHDLKATDQKVPAADCNNQSPPPLIRYLSACSAAEGELFSTCRLFHMRLNMENVDKTMTTSNSRRWSKTRWRPAALLYRTFHTIQHVRNTQLCLQRSKPEDLIDPTRIFCCCHYGYISRYYHRLLQIHTVLFSSQEWNTSCGGNNAWEYDKNAPLNM